jgi:uncharacterized protein YjiS (DUF1127 family)
MSSIAHTQTSLSLNPAYGARHVAGGLIRRLIETIRFELEVRRSLREVQGFDDKMLRDIGLQRGGIEHAIRNGVSEIALRDLTGR